MVLQKLVSSCLPLVNGFCLLGCTTFYYQCSSSEHQDQVGLSFLNPTLVPISPCKVSDEITLCEDVVTSDWKSAVRKIGCGACGCGVMCAWRVVGRRWHVSMWKSRQGGGWNWGFIESQGVRSGEWWITSPPKTKPQPMTRPTQTLELYKYGIYYYY